MSLFTFLRNLFGKPDLVEVGHWPRTDGERVAAMTRAPEGWSWVKTLETSSGKVLEEKWVFKPPPERVPSHGLAHLRPYLETMVASDNWMCSLSAFTLDEERWVLIHRIEGQLKLIDWFTPDQNERERRARAFLAEHGCRVAEDYVDMQGTRHVYSELPEDVEAAEALVRLYAVAIAGISEEEGLDFAFEEHEDERHKFTDSEGITFTFTYPQVDANAPAPVENQR